MFAMCLEHTIIETVISFGGGGGGEREEDTAEDFSGINYPYNGTVMLGAML